MKTKVSCKIGANVKKTGIQIAAALEEIEKSVLLTALNIISLCTSFAFNRFSQNNHAVNNGAN
jgi:hypothetical protein